MTRHRTLCLLLALAVVAGCGTSRTHGTDMTQAQRDTLATVQQRLATLRAEIDSLDQRSARASAHARAGLEQELAALRAERDSAATQLRVLQNAGRETWENTKIETDRALAGLEQAIATARGHLHADSAQFRP